MKRPLESMIDQACGVKSEDYSDAKLEKKSPLERKVDKVCGEEDAQLKLSLAREDHKLIDGLKDEVATLGSHCDKLTDMVDKLADHFQLLVTALDEMRQEINYASMIARDFRFEVRRT